jgi:CheY-like chemotaxis protein
MLTKIISNLLSNALKFTPEGGSVTLYARMIELLGTAYLEIVVTDNGEGIKKEDLPFIFTKFFRADHTLTKTSTGTGIGLTLTKELVELLKGEITVESIPRVGTTFKVILPVTHHSEMQDTSLLKPQWNETIIASGSANIYSDESIIPDRACVLIVEDNAEVARYTASCLGKEYEVRFAANGDEGIHKAFEIIPDLVISDVMMPLKDGFELLHTLKEDQRTSHIPVILLTARTEAEDRLEGLRRGADAYLNKPFIEEELQILTAQLLQLRKKLQQRYAAPMVAPGKLSKPDEAEIEAFDLEIEDTFYRKVLSILEANFDNTSFSNEELYRQMHMSRTQLHRKLAAVTGHSPNQLLLQIRLRNAKRLLTSTDAPVSEIAYSTGFNQPSYFARAFAKESGMSPSEYRAKQRQ